MSVILNDAAIAKLFEAPEGPVARFVEREAEKVAGDVAKNIKGYFHTATTLTVHLDVEVDMNGSTATVGVRNTDADHVGESKTRRLQRTGWLDKWFRQALERA